MYSRDKKKKSIVDKLSKMMTLCYKVSPRNVIGIVGLNIMGGILPVALMFMWQCFLDSIAAIYQQENLSTYFNMLEIIIFYTLVLFTQNLVNKGIQFLTQNESDQIEIQITKMVLDQIGQLSTEDFENTELYNSIKRVWENITRSTLQVLQNFILMIRNGIMLVGVCLVFVQLDYSPIGICIIGAIPSFVISLKIMKKWHEIYSQRCEKLRYIECLKNIVIKSENIKEIKLYKLDIYFNSVISKEYMKFNEENKHVRKNFLYMSSMADIFEMFWHLLAKVYTIIKCISLKKTIGEVTLFINAIQQFSSSLQMILEIIKSLYDSNLYIDELYEFLNLNKNVVENTEFLEFERFKNLELKNVSFKYANMTNNVLNNVYLKIEPNKVYAIVGENGSGKSTLLNLMAGLFSEYEGEILLNNKKIETYDRKTYYSNVGIVFQNYLKLPLSIKDNIEVGQWEKKYDTSALYKAASFSGVDKFVDVLPNGFQSMLHKEWNGGGQEISIGQWQKVALARAVFGEKDILFMDEPTSSLDEKSTKRVFDNLKKSEKTCVYIVHSKELALKADIIIYIENGNVQVMKTTEWKERSGV